MFRPPAPVETDDNQALEGGTGSPGSTAAVYQALAAHQVSRAEGWDLQAWVQELHRWKSIFESEFKLELPPVAFCIKPTYSNCYGYFRPGHNEFGLTREIAINRLYLTCREPWQVLGTLLHELLHAWQDAYGKPGKRNYHNAEFRAWALQYGLIIDSTGVTEYAPKSRFMDLLKSHGVSVPELRAPVRVPRVRGTSKLKKWSCGCTNVRVAVAGFRALCLNCTREFACQD